MEKVNGRDIFVMWPVGGTYMCIAGTRSNDAVSSSDMIEVSSVLQGKWREYRSGRKEWSVNVSYLVLADGSNGIDDLLRVGETVRLRISRRGGGYLYGDAIVKECRVTSTTGNLVQGSFVFKGSGALLKSPE